MKWVQSYCRLSHGRARAQRPPEQLCAALKTVPLLGTRLFSSHSLCCGCVSSRSILCAALSDSWELDL